MKSIDEFRDAEIVDIVRALTGQAALPPIVRQLDKLDWLTVSERLKTYLKRNSENLVRDEFARVYAAFIYAVEMGDEYRNPAQGRKVSEQLMMIATLLGKLPPDEDFEPLSPTFAFELFLSGVGMSIEEARGLAEDWRLPGPSQSLESWELDNIRRLRRIKGLLNVMAAIRPHLGDSPYGAALDEWAELWPRLP
jgi:hypothetical protein